MNVVAPARRGLIPARAGNTIWRVDSPVTAWAHPRSRGEHLSALTGALPAAGSSPLARGTLNYTLVFTQASGLIPARAGNTLPG